MCAGAPDPGEAGLVEPLGAVLSQLSAGGGAKGINIDDVTAQLERLTREYPFEARPLLVFFYPLARVFLYAACAQTSGTSMKRLLSMYCSKCLIKKVYIRGISSGQTSTCLYLNTAI